MIFNLEFKANSTGLAVVTRMRDKKQLCFVKIELDQEREIESDFFNEGFYYVWPTLLELDLV